MNERDNHNLDVPIGIVAGGGHLVFEVLSALEHEKRPHFVAAIRHETELANTSDHVRVFDWGEIGRILSFFRKNKCHELALIGSISKRPDFRSIVTDTGTMLRLPKILAAMTGGDDTLLTRVVRLIEAEGFTLIGIDQLVPTLLLQQGNFGSVAMSKTCLQDIGIGRAVFRDLAKHDVGQALVVEAGRVLAVEAAEGTDNMLRRIADLKASGSIRSKRKKGVLIKASKAAQDLRVDLPTIGPKTVDLSVKAGLCGIVAESGRVLVAERSKTRLLADQAGFFIQGMDGFHDD